MNPHIYFMVFEPAAWEELVPLVAIVIGVVFIALLIGAASWVVDWYQNKS